MNSNQQKLLSILVFFRDLCEKNHIWYSLACGTLLGAVRESGFISWDSDADVVILFEDKKKVREAFRNTNQSLFEIIDYDDDPKCLQSHDSIRLKGDDSGYHLDIYPLIGAPENRKKRIRFSKRIALDDKLIRSKHKRVSRCKPKNRFAVALVKALLLPFPDALLIKRIRKNENKYPLNNSSYVVIHSNDGNADATMLKEKWLDSAPVHFEGFWFSGPKDSDYILRHFYGPDYMVPKEY